ncbi:ankyrin repeat-containing domain protein [Halenospora varia]|nr:ankyrin repeat-containing domain protein [Halenospora varia]
MDPLSLVASLTGTIGFALKASKLLYDLIDGTLDAPKDVSAVAREAKVFVCVLESLQQLIHDGKLHEEATLPLQPPLDNCLQTLSTLTSRIQPHIKETGDARASKWKGFTWTFKKEETRNLCHRLTQNSMTLNTAILIMNSIKINANSNQVGQVDDRIQQLRGELRARDGKKIALASVTGKYGSDCGRTDGGFALRRFLESESVIESPPDDATYLDSGDEETSGGIQSTVGSLFEIQTEVQPRIQGLVRGTINSPQQTKPREGHLGPSVGDEHSVRTKESDMKANNHPQSSIEVISNAATELPQNLIFSPHLELELDFACDSAESKAPKLTSDSATIKAATEAMFEAVEISDIPAMISCLSIGASINAIDQIGFSALYYATDAGNLEMVQELIDRGCDVNTRCTSSSTPTALYLTIEKHAEEILKVLLKAGGDIDMEGPKDIIKLLLDNGANPHVIENTEDGYAPIHRAAIHCRVEGLKLFLDLGADANAKSKFLQTPLMLAAGLGKIDTMEMLFQHGADLNSQDEEGCSAIHYSVSSSQVEATSWFLDRGVDVNSENNKGATALYMSAQNGHQVIVEYLLEKGADVNSKMRNGATPLHISAQNGHQVVVEYLLEKGADPRSTYKYGGEEWTAMDCARHNNHPRIVKLLSGYLNELSSTIPPTVQRSNRIMEMAPS